MSAKRKLKPIALVFLVAIVSLASGSTSSAGTYYVDRTGGDDANPGTSATEAWASISRVNSARSSPGDWVVFKRGEVWQTSGEVLQLKEQVNYGAYGTGDAPVIEAAYDATQWSLEDGGLNLYSTVIAGNLAQGDWEMAWEDGVAGTRRTELAGVLSPRDFYFDGANLYYIPSDGADPDTHTMRFSANGTSAAEVQGDGGLVTELTFRFGGDEQVYNFLPRNGWTFESVSFLQSSRFGFRTYAVIDGFTFSDCSVIRNGQGSLTGDTGHGLAFLDGATNTLVTNCTIDGNGGKGVHWGGDVTGSKISHCYVANNASAGITLAPQASPGLVIEFNEVANNATTVFDRSGIDIFSQAIVRYNLAYGNAIGSGAGHGIQADATSVAGADSALIYYNVCLGNQRGGISLISVADVQVYNNVCAFNQYGIENAGAASGLLVDPIVKNNILYANTKHQIIVLFTDGTPVFDYNLYYDPDDGLPIIWWHGVGYNSPAEFSFFAGQEAHGIELDPLFVDAANGDFHLQFASPARDAGVDLGLSLDFDQLPVPQGAGVDIGAFEFATDPVAIDDEVNIEMDLSVAVLVLANDSDPFNDLEITTLSSPVNGTAVIDDNGTAGDATDDFVDYTPDPGFSGVDRFDYTIEGGQGGSDTATVTVTVYDPRFCPEQSCDANGICTIPSTHVFQDSGTYSGTHDTVIREGTPNQNKGALDNWDWDANQGGTGSQNVGLIRFDGIVGDAPGRIPPGSLVDSAVLTLTVYDSGQLPAADIKEVLVDWDELVVTWNNFGGDAGIQPEEIGDFVAQAPVEGGAMDIDVSASVQAWVNDPSSNRGWAFLPNSNTGVHVRSSEYTVQAQRPKLTVEVSSHSDLDQDGLRDSCDLDDGLIYILFEEPNFVEWQNEVDFYAWNLYSGDLDLLKSTGEYTQAQECGLTDTISEHVTAPGTGKVTFFLVSGSAGGVENSLGNNSLGAERSNTSPCP